MTKDPEESGMKCSQSAVNFFTNAISIFYCSSHATEDLNFATFSKN
jgi:hypothetical protein